MGIVSKKQGMKSGKSGNGAQGERKEAKVVNIFDKALAAGTKKKLDATQDAWERNAPPPFGVYQLKPIVNAKSVKQGETDDGDVYYSVELECKVVNNKEYEGATIYEKLPTYLRRGKDISAAAAFLVKGGKEIPEEADDITIARKVVNFCKAEPTMYALLDWQGWSSKQNQFAVRSMAECPVNEDTGLPMHIFRTADGEEITARAVVKKWMTKEEAKELIEELKEKAKGAKKASVKDDDEEEEAEDDVEEASDEDTEETEETEETTEETEEEDTEESEETEEATDTDEEAVEEAEEEVEEEVKVVKPIKNTAAKAGGKPVAVPSKPVTAAKKRAMIKGDD